MFDYKLAQHELNCGRPKNTAHNDENKQ